MATDKLTDRAISAAKPGDKPLRLYDGGGLYLEVTPKGGKWWRFKYRFDGKEKLLSMGTYPDTPLAGRWVDKAKQKAQDESGYLKGARDKRDDARQLVAAGIDPSAERKARAAATTDQLPADSFEIVAREFHATKSPEWSGPHAARWLERMTKDVFPWLGSIPLPEISAPMLLKTLRRVEARGVRETVHAIHQGCGQVFRYGIATGRCERNPAADLRGALQPVLVKNMAAIVEPAQAGDLMRAIAGYQGHPLTRAALELSALLFQRPGNVRTMEWAELDLDGAAWIIPAAKMKRARHGKINGRPHLVPLAPQAVNILRDLEPLTGNGPFVFPSMLSRERPMSENTVNTALRRLGFDKTQATAHGFRAMARTILVEKLNVDPEVIEAQLAHGKGGSLGTAYDRAEYVDKRRAVMVLWADYLDALRKGAKVLPFKAA